MNGPKMNSKVAYIIVGWNNLDLLEECINSVKTQTHQNYSIIYVDNDSKDESVVFMKHKFPEVIIIEPGYNTGFAKGNNIGIEHALKDPSVEYIALLNTDARFDSIWTQTIVDFAQKKPKGALFQGTTLDYYNHDIIDSTHIFVSHNGQGTQGNWRHYFRGEFGPKKIYGVNAAACLISRSFIEAQPFGAELFDETMFMYLEDIDLATRSIIMGWDNYLVPRARAYHMGSVSSSKNPGYSLYMTFRNNGAVLFKNFPIRIILRIYPSLVRGDIETIKTLYRTNRKRAIPKVIKGRIIGMLRMPLFIRKRRALLRKRRANIDYIWSLMNKGY